MIASNKNPFEGIPVIYSYNRAQAIEDGVLVDLSAWAKETGFTLPVACTAAVWHQYVVPPGDTQKLGQSERGRAHDLLHMLYVAIRKQPGTSDRLLYKVICPHPRCATRAWTTVAPQSAAWTGRARGFYWRPTRRAGVWSTWR